MLAGEVLGVVSVLVSVVVRISILWVGRRKEEQARVEMLGGRLKIGGTSFRQRDSPSAYLELVDGMPVVCAPSVVKLLTTKAGRRIRKLRN